MENPVLELITHMANEQWRSQDSDLGVKKLHLFISFKDYGGNSYTSLCFYSILSKKKLPKIL